MTSAETLEWTRHFEQVNRSFVKPNPSTFGNLFTDIEHDVEQVVDPHHQGGSKSPGDMLQGALNTTAQDAGKAFQPIIDQATASAAKAASKAAAPLIDKATASAAKAAAPLLDQAEKPLIDAAQKLVDNETTQLHAMLKTAAIWGGIGVVVTVLGVTYLRNR